jgi:hypothetical protein
MGLEGNGGGGREASSSESFMETATFNTEATEALKRGTIGDPQHRERRERTGRFVSQRLRVLRGEFFSVPSVCNSFSAR